MSRRVLLCWLVAIAIFYAPTVSHRSLLVPCAECEYSLSDCRQKVLALHSFLPLRIEHGNVSYHFSFCSSMSPGCDGKSLVCLVDGEHNCSWDHDGVAGAWVDCDTASVILNFVPEQCGFTSVHQLAITCSPQLLSNLSTVVLQLSGDQCARLKQFLLTVEVVSTSSSTTTSVPVTTATIIKPTMLTSTSITPNTSTPNASAVITPTSTVPTTASVTTAVTNFSSAVTTSSNFTPTTTSNFTTSTTATNFISTASSNFTSTITSSFNTTTSLTSVHSLSTPTSSVVSTSISSPAATPTSSPTAPHHKTGGSDMDTNKLLYIVIPTAVPAAFVLSCLLTFCFIRCVDRQRRKKLYIRLVPTVYADEDSDSD